MKNKFLTFKNYCLTHRMLTGVVLLALLFGGYKVYASLTSTDGEPRYVIGEASVQTIIASIAGSGQVSTENLLEIKPKVSGDITFVGVTAGSEVTVGTLIGVIDARDAQKTVRDAEVNLESAKLTLEKLKQPADTLSLTQGEHALLRARESRANAEASLVQSYEEGFNSVSSTFLDLPTVMTGLQDMLFGYTQSLDSNSQNIDAYTTASRRYDDVKADQYRTDAYNKYQTARAAYTTNFDEYKSTSRLSGTSSIAMLITHTYEATRSVADAVKSANNLIQYYKDNLTQHSITTAPIAGTHLSILNTYTNQTNTHLGALLSVADSIKTSSDTLTNSARSITEDTEALMKLKLGTDPLDIASAQIGVTQRENALRDAREKLGDYYIRAPFAGTIAKLNIKKTDSVTSGTAVATLITKQKIAEISLNEVDAAKVRTGQKVTLTFDAIDELTIAGTVVLVDTVGTISQGVVTYTVRISFDAQDERVKSGMSVSAGIVTAVKQRVLAVPASAVKSRGDSYYVQILDGATGVSDTAGILSTATPREQIVEIGLSDDTSTEIISGVSEGTLIVTRTINNAVKATTAPSLFGGSGTRLPRN